MSSVAAGATAGTAVGIVSAATTGGSVAGAAAAGAVSGAVAGTIAGGAGTAAAVGGVAGAATGAAASAAVTSASAGATGLVTTGLALGPVGWLALGSTQCYTFDCWKPVLHDESTTPSNGILLKDIVVDPRIKMVTSIQSDNCDDLPQIYLENIWDEKYRIDYVMLPSNKLAAHAIKM